MEINFSAAGENLKKILNFYKKLWQKYDKNSRTWQKMAKNHKTMAKHGKFLKHGKSMARTPKTWQMPCFHGNVATLTYCHIKSVKKSDEPHCTS